MIVRGGADVHVHGRRIQVLEHDLGRGIGAQRLGVPLFGQWDSVSTVAAAAAPSTTMFAGRQPRRTERSVWQSRVRSFDLPSRRIIARKCRRFGTTSRMRSSANTRIESAALPTRSPLIDPLDDLPVAT